MTGAIHLIQTIVIGLGDVLICLVALTFVWLVAGGDRLDYATERTPAGESTGGQLNPTWVEWLMGWPLWWTDLKPLATDRFRAWQQQHSASFQETDA